MRSTGVLVIGGGASGMIAALEARKQGANVLIIEKMNKLGKKLLATGNGKCNYTNYYQSEECYRGEDTHFIWKALGIFGQADTVELFKSFGIMPSEREGYVYPLSGQASSVRNILCRELEKAKVELHTSESVKYVTVHTNKKTENREGFIVETNKDKYLARCVIIATGGKSYPVHGSDGSGYEIAKSFGHTIITPLPALTSCVTDKKYTKDWAGVRVRGRVCAFNENNNLMAEDTGEIQFVESGISGIPVFQISRYISVELAYNRKPYIIMDIMPDFEEDEIEDELYRRKEICVGGSVGDLFEGLLHNKLAAALLKKCNISISGACKDFNSELIKKTVSAMKNWHIDISATGGFDKAQVTRGGVSVSEINVETMESKFLKNLYFAGELLDVDGICGGYNLQWAWTSGYIAGKSAGASQRN